MMPSRSNRDVSAACIFTLLLLFTISAMAAQARKQPTGSPQDVLTHHGDNLRTGWSSSETQLTVSNVNPSSFGLLQTVVVDERVDAQPLYVSQQTIQGKGVHNVIYVATENNSVYAIDADNGSTLWQRNFGPPVPWAYNDDDNVYPVMGILSTPVIDRTAGNLYFVAATFDNSKGEGFRLHAISLSTGKDVIKSRAIQFTAKLANGKTWKFNPQEHLQRPGLLETSGSIYVAFGSNGDIVPDQSRGVIGRYDATTLTLLGSDVADTLYMKSSPYYLSSIWQSGYGPAADENGDVYFSTGNSDPWRPSYSVHFNRPDSVVRLSGDLTALLDSFTPSDYFFLDQEDLDLGSAGMMLIPAQLGSIPHLTVAGSKDGRAFLLNRDNLGGYTPGGPDNVIQTVDQGMCWCGPAYFMGADGNPYVLTGGGNGVTSWQLQTSPSVQLIQGASTGPGPADGLPEYGGAIPVVSSNGTAPGSAVVWFIQKPQTSSDSDPGTPVTLMAYDASNLQNQLISIQAGTWTHAVNSNANVVPTVANGRVYVASNKQLQIFGLLPPPGSAARAALPHAVEPSKPEVIACAPSEAPLTAVGSVASSIHQFYGTVCHVSGNELQLSLRSGHSITIDIGQAFTRHRRVPLTLGRAVHVQATIEGKGVAHALLISPSHMLSPRTPADR
jgi:outer membrane protein assembly factor BamB